ncbi:MAG: DUF4329 domain-containing protein, partial [Erythrobacter sp.]|nr:DUF4329 domain-containing protein [Erythrobacter sp.]
AIAWVVIIARAYVFKKDPEDFVITVTQAEVQAFARAQLSAIQQRSFSEGIELCGIIFERSDGSLGASRVREGGEASCGIAYFDEPGMRPVASFHTHGGFNTDYDSEVPSLLDLESDAASGMDGYVATPGGRFWWVDAAGPVATNVCGPGCLPQDPRYQPCPGLAPKPRYSYRELAQRQLGSARIC